MNFEAAKNFVYRNARPLEMARWKYLFENGSKEDVLTALSYYQNEDGGFGYALEADCWNPNSSPIQTWAATEIIREVKLEDRSHPIIQGILKYLSSGKDFNGHTWANTVASNNRYPHAEWWEDEPGKGISYNPTAALLGFILKFADAGSALSQRALPLAREAFAYLKKAYPLESVGNVSCFVKLYEYLKECSLLKIVDLEEFQEILSKQIQHVITYDTDLWDVEYVCKPSFFIHTKGSDFYLENAEICQSEYDFIQNSQLADGTWKITWSWRQDPEQWHISKNWWKSDWILKSIQYANAMKAGGNRLKPWCN